MKYRIFNYTCVVLLLMTVSGCASHHGPQVRMLTASGKNVCKLAVLPFANETGQTAAAIQVYRIFTSELIASRNYRVEPEGEVYFFLNRSRLMLGDLLDSQDYAELARQLEVDAIVRGRVIALEERKSAQGSPPNCALQIDLLSADNGELLASTYHRRSGEEFQKILHFGTIRTTSQLVSQVSREIIDAWNKKGLSHCLEE